MYIDFSGLFHRSSKDLSGGDSVRIAKDDNEWPEEWKTVYYKTYPRLKKIPLPKTEPQADLFDLIKKRRSDRNFSQNVLDPAKLSTLLKYSCGIVEEYDDWNPRRAHPSGGGRFPLEVYPILFSDAGEIPAGIYHYNVKDHMLDVLHVRKFSKDDIAEMAVYDWVQNASCILVMSAVFRRSHIKYGERGYRYIMLEAGHIGQNVYLNSMALGIKCTALGGTRDAIVEKLLDIDGIDESLVYALVLG